MKKILIVEDEQDIAELLRLYLESEKLYPLFLLKLTLNHFILILKLRKILMF